MLADHDSRRTRATPFDGSDPAYPGPGRASAVHRFLGGSPAGVIVRLLFLSILAGAVMSLLGLTPGQLFRHAYESGRALVELGLASLHDFGGWVLAGAAVVVPLWLVSRLLAVSR